MTYGGARLTLITQWFTPEPATVPVWIAEAMAEWGWNVSVLTGIPNYPDGEVHSGYRAWRPEVESRRGLHVVRAPLYPSHDRSAIGRALNYLSWAFSAVLVGRRTLRQSDAVLVYATPATVGLPALVARWRAGVPYVLFIQDLWPDSIFATGFMQGQLVRRLAAPLLTWFVMLTYRYAASIAVITPGMKEALIKRGVPESKVHVVYNWTDEKIFRPRRGEGAFRSSLGLHEDDLLFLYAGNLGAAQSLDTLVEAFREVSPHCHLVLVGSGIEEGRLRTLAGSQPNIHFQPPVPLEQVPELQADADILLVSLGDDPLFEITIPGKTQVSLAAGRPVLTLARGDVARLIEHAGAGIAASPSNSVKAANAVRRLAAMAGGERKQMGNRASSFYLAEMSRAVGGERLHDLLVDAVVAPDPSKVPLSD